MFCVKLSINNHIVRLVHKKHIRTCLMYHAACTTASWVSTIHTVVLTADVFQLFILRSKILPFGTYVKPHTIHVQGKGMNYERLSSCWVSRLPGLLAAACAWDIYIRISQAITPQLAAAPLSNTGRVVNNITYIPNLGTTQRAREQRCAM